MVTISEIATAAGVSRYTASKVLNHDMSVSEASRKAVLAACEKLGYIPNLNAINLVKGHSSVIGMIVPYISDGFYCMMLEEMEGIAEKNGFILIYKSYYNNGLEEANIIRTMLSMNVCGLLIVPPVRELNPEMHKLASQNVPVVYLDRPPALQKYCCILNDNVKSAETICEHLLKHGDSLALLDSFYGKSNPTAMERRRGYENIMEMHHLPPCVIPHVTSTEKKDSELYAYQRVRAFFKNGGKCTSLFCMTDAAAFGAERAARECGLTPGQDFFVGGHDALPFGAFSNPPLTTMRQPTGLICQKAWEILFDAINGKPVPHQHFVFPSELIARKSGCWQEKLGAFVSNVPVLLRLWGSGLKIDCPEQGTKKTYFFPYQGIFRRLLLANKIFLCYFMPN